MTATIDQVAKKAGVSKATVSRVINNSKPVSNDKRARVIKAIEELNFKPNPAARSLVSKKSKIIGVVVTDIANHFVSVLVKSIEDIAYNAGYSILICNSYFSAKKENELLMMLKDKRVDGIIFLTTGIKEEQKSFFSQVNIPVALVNVGYSGKNIISIGIDNRKAACEITSYFLEKGLTRVGMIRAPLDDVYSGKDRFTGYCDALQKYNIPYIEDFVREGKLEAADGYQAAASLCENGINPQALFVACDLMAFGAIKAIVDHGYKVPEDIEVAGFDDVPMASFYHPTLTTVRQPIEEMGRLAAEKLICLIEENRFEQEELILPYQVILRESTAR
jgi:LacI family transcriptional regulator